MFGRVARFLVTIPALALALTLGALGLVFHRRIRLLTVPAALAGGGYAVYASNAVPAAPPDGLSDADSRALYEVLFKRVKRNGQNHLHSRRLYAYAGAFAAAAHANPDAVRAAALLHDATKEDGAGDPKERFCTHGEQGAAYAQTVLKQLGKSDAFIANVSTAIRQHMGPRGFNWRFLSRRFMSKFCPSRDFPEPKSPEAKVLYDIDMLDLMTVNGLVKVIEFRQTQAEFGKETLRESALSGSDSAWKSVVDARQTLITRAARECGEALEAHSKAFLDGIDWEQVRDVAAFKEAAASYLRRAPLPACLPAPAEECG